VAFISLVLITSTGDPKQQATNPEAKAHAMWVVLAVGFMPMF
jgi:hypothetical protein